MRKELFSSGLLAALTPFFYTSTCTIKYYTVENPDTFGQPQPAWIDFPGHVNLDCTIAPNGDEEVKRLDMTIAKSTHIIAIAGYYPTITAAMRVVISGVTYGILLVETDSKSKMTRLTVDIVV